MIYCAACGHPSQPDLTQCANCGAALGTLPNTPEFGGHLPTELRVAWKSPFGTGNVPPYSAAPSVSSIPFENRSTLGFWNSLISTWKLSALDPNNFFPLVGETQDTTSAVWYGFTVTCAAMLLGVLLSLPFRLFQAGAMFGTISHQSSASAASLSALAILVTVIVSIVFIPVGAIISLFITAALIHASLLLVGGGPLGFAATLRTLCYAKSPSIIPLVGWVWGIYLQIVGLARAHKVEVWRPLVIYIVSFLLLIAFIILCVIAFFFMISTLHTPHPFGT